MAHGATGCSRIPPSGQIHGKRESLRLHESVSMKTFSKKTIRRYFSGALIALMLSSGLWAQGNDKLQLHFIDVGQGDGAILISPGGQVVAFDIGQDLVHRNCDKPASYYDQLGITKLVYLFVSHYHQDHIGCVPEVLKNIQVGSVLDRGFNYKSTFYDSYIAAIGANRHTGSIWETFVLDQNMPQPVTLRVVEV
jgi:beta-lactamase superfamily II metal-dependent hydrolase